MGHRAVSRARRAAWVLAWVVMSGCQPTGLAPIEGGGGGGGVVPSPGAATDTTLTPSATPATPGFPVVLPPIDTGAPPLQPATSAPSSAAPTATPGTTLSPAPFPAISPPPSPGLGAAGGA